jgi:hypothetical protein
MNSTNQTPTTRREPLSTLISVRVRLSQEEREALKAAYQRAVEDSQQESAPVVSAGSSIRVQHNGGNAERSVTRDLGMNYPVFCSLINSREALSSATVFTLQNVLGVELLTPQRCREALDSYIQHVFGE